MITGVEPNRISIPLSFQQRIEAIHGETGKAWLAQLPILISTYSSEWGLKLGRPLSSHSNNFVLEAEDLNQNLLIFKAGISKKDIASEITALQVFSGNSSVELIAAEPKDGVMLIRRAIPGTTLDEITLQGNDDDAVLIACRIILQMQRQSRLKERHHFSQSLEDWSKGFQRLRDKVKGNQCPFDIVTLDRAEKGYLQLLKTTSESILLHGDLHHFNILKSDIHSDSWLAIDPQGVWGDPVFEVAAFMRNPFPAISDFSDVKKLMKRRIELFSEYLQFDKKRIWAWSFAQTALASCWQYLDLGKDWEAWWRLAHLFLDIEILDDNY